MRFRSGAFVSVFFFNFAGGRWCLFFFSFCLWMFNCSDTIHWKDIFPPLNWFSTFVKISWSYLCGFISWSSISLIYVCPLAGITHLELFNVLKSSGLVPLTLTLYYLSFRIILFISTKNLAGILIGILLNLYIDLKRIGIITMLSFPIHEHGMAFHFI